MKTKKKRQVLSPRVLLAIESERTYQEAKYPGHLHSVGEWLLILEKCLNDGKAAWNRHGDMAALREIRQVTAVGVAAMDQCGAPIRNRKPEVKEIVYDGRLKYPTTPRS